MPDMTVWRGRCVLALLTAGAASQQAPWLQEVARVEVPVEEVVAAAVDADGVTLATVTAEGTVRVFTLAPWRELRAFDVALRGAERARIDGQTLVSSGATPALLVDVGQALARLHALPLGPVRPGPDHRIALSHAADAVGVLCPALATRTRELAAVLGESLPADGLRVVSHGDFSLDNLLMSAEGEVTGVIDVGRAGIADRYRDLAILANCLDDFGPALSEVFFSAYGIATPDARKLEFHLLLDECF